MFFDIDGRGTEIYPTGIYHSLVFGLDSSRYICCRIV